MPVDDINNPFLRAPEMRTSGQTLLPHDGQTPTLGAGRRIGISILSPIEFIFRETDSGRGSRGSNTLKSFYRLRQNTTSTKIWSFLPRDGWLLPYSRGLENDDPVDTAELALSYQTSPQPLISFYDSPGFTLPPHDTFGVNRQATKVFLLQCFQVWCEVSPRFSQGTFQASPARRWNNLICVRRADAATIFWEVTSAVLIAGLAEVTRPLCD